MFYNFKMALSLGPFFLLTLLFLSTNVKSGDLGTTGLIDVPSARMMQDGFLRATITKQDTVSVYSLNYQATPWLKQLSVMWVLEDFSLR